MMRSLYNHTKKKRIGLLIVALSFSMTNLLAQTKASTIEVPPEMERNFDQLLADWRKNMKMSPACDLMDRGNITYPDSVYINRLHAYPTQMELPYNQIVRSYIDMYTNRNRNSVAVMLGKGAYYNPIFENALDRYGLPNELKYLPVIESAINPTAVSRAGATGLWQFMVATGKMYDLEVNSLVDERRDPRRSTDAAARYLRDLFDIYGDWNLVIAAYNCGPGNVNKAIRRSGGQTDYWAIYPFLPKETRGYVPAFIAATYAMTHPEKHNICAMESTLPLSTDTLMVDYNVHFEQISQVLNISIDDIRNLNPQYKRDIVPGEYKAYSLCLPSQKTVDFISKKNQIMDYKREELLTHRKTVEPEGGVSSSSASSSGGKVYRVKRGNTLGGIAKKYGVTTNQLKRWNNLKSNSVSVGRRLIVSNPVKAQPAPAKKAAPAKQETGENTSSENQSSPVLTEYFEKQKQKNKNVQDTSTVVKPEEREKNLYDTGSSSIYHKVRIGETMTSISKKYEVSVSDIKKWNKLSSNVAKVGQRLLINLPPKKEVAENAQDVDAKSEETVAAKKVAEKKAPIKPTKPVAEKKTVYTVKSGDSLSKIASKHKVSVNSIKKENGLKNDQVKIGQKLVIPRK